MVCSYCNSTDIIDAQGELFCANCGRQLDKAPAKAGREKAARAMGADISGPKRASAANAAPPGNADGLAPDMTVLPATSVAEKIEVGENGLPEGVTIAPMAGVEPPVVEKKKRGAKGKVAAAAKSSAAKKSVPATTKAAPEISEVAAAAETAVVAKEPAVVKSAAAETAAEPTAASDSFSIDDLEESVAETVAALTPAPAKPDAGTNESAEAVDTADDTANAKDIASNAEDEEDGSPAAAPAANVMRDARPIAPARHTSITDELPSSSFLGLTSFSAALFSATLLCIAATVILAFVLSGIKFDQTPRLLVNGGWEVWGALIMAGILFYFCRSLAGAAVAYGSARRGDHRPVPLRRWAAATANNIHSLVALDVIIGLKTAALVAAGGWLLIYGPSVLANTPLYFTSVVLFTAFAALVYAALGVTTAWRLAQPALVLGKIGVIRALWLGWRFYVAHPELISAAVFTTVVELVSLSSALLLITVILAEMPTSQNWLLGVAAVPAVIIGAGLEGAYGADWWQKTYRRLIRRERLSEALQLLAGRTSDKIKPGSVVLIWLLVIIFAAGVAFWPWLP